MGKDDLQFKLRIPEKIKEWVTVRAKANRRSVTAEIVIILEDKMDKEKGGTTA